MNRRIILIAVYLLVYFGPLSIISAAKAPSSSQIKGSELMERLTKIIGQHEEKLLKKLTVFESIVCSMKIRCEAVDASVWTNPVHSIVCPKYKLFIESDKCDKSLAAWD